MRQRQENHAAPVSSPENHASGISGERHAADRRDDQPRRGSGKIGGSRPSLSRR